MESHPGVEGPDGRAVKCAGFLLAVRHVHFEDHDLRTIRAPRPSPHSHVAEETFAPRNKNEEKKRVENDETCFPCPGVSIGVTLSRDYL